METPIIDAHHHIWRRGDLPWLDGPMVPRIFGPYEPIRRDYPMSEYLDDIAGAGVVKSVYVQANWPPEKAEDEVAWVESVADETGWPHAIVGYADLMADDARHDDRAPGALPAPARHPHAAALAREPAIPLRQAARSRRRTRPSGKNFAALADHGLSFDLQVFHRQMGTAARLAEEFPETTFILQHAGMLEDLSDEGPRGLAGGHGRARRAAERGRQALRPRHLHPPQRSRPHRLDRR